MQRLAVGEPLLSRLTGLAPAASVAGAAVPQQSRTFAAAATAQQQVTDTYDVVVFGGGMVGIALAALLGTNPVTRSLKVAVVDRQKLSGEQKPLGGPPDARVSTITPASAKILERIGAWHALAPPVSASFSSMQVWDAAGQAFIRYEASDVGATHIGHVIENARLQAAIVQQLTLPGRGGAVQLLAPASLESLTLPAAAAATPGEGAGLAQLQLEGGRRLAARLVVGADGANSRTRAAAGLRTIGWGYGQRGLVAGVATDAPNEVAWQRFLPEGPLALLPVRGGLSNVVWSITPEKARELEQCTSEQFAAAVNRALGNRSAAPTAPLTAALRRWLPAGGGNGSSGSGNEFLPPPLVTGWVGAPPRSFPLQLRHAGRYVRRRVALVGDAAHAVHPLAGQGVNLGLADAAALADALATAVESGADVGDADFLAEAYEAPRQRANVAMMSALDALGRIFTPQSGPLAAARSLGLDALNAAPLVKRRIMKYAMGWE